MTIAVIGKWVTVLLALFGFVWGIANTLQSNALTARRPFLDLQLKLYEEATAVAAVLATSDDPIKRGEAEKRFWELYWGELALVENGGLSAPGNGVEGAMVRFGDRLNEHASREALTQPSLDIAYACRDSLAHSWRVSEWIAPRVTPQTDLKR